MLFDDATQTPEAIRTRVEEAIGECDRLLAGVVGATGDRTFSDTLLPIDDIRDVLARTEGVTGFLGYVHPDPAVRAAGRDAEARLSRYAVDLVFREDLYRAVRDYAKSAEAAALEGEPARLLAFLLRDFRKAGHELEPEARRRLHELTSRLVDLGVAFEQNIAEHQDHLLVTEGDLDGLPEGYLETLEPGDEEGTYRVTMAYPHVVPFLENAHRRDLRRELSRKFNSRAVAANRPLLEEAVRIREEVAELFGLPSWAHHQLDDRMARTPERVEEFYAALRPALTEAARRDIARMEELLRADGEEPPLESYDWRYYDTRLRKADYGVDPAEVASYFPLDHVLDGLLRLTGEVFGLRYERVEAPTWHEEVVTYAMRDTGSGDLLAHFHMDLFPREGKFSHAAAFSLVPGRRRPDRPDDLPVAAIVANLTRPTASRPSLLQHDEVVTLFHEFGHILHQTLARTGLTTFAGTNTERDFVEAPSQIMEHWVWNADVLRTFARHHRTGEPIPDRLVERLVEARRLDIAVVTLRQMSLGMLDLMLHGPGKEKDLDRILVEATDVSLLPLQEGTFFPASFGHLFGYDAGYYGYLWSEVYGDDMFSRFEQEGVTSPEVGRAYRRAVLERGGSRDGIEMLREFLGREPDNRAFLRKLGIAT